jgi:hypothetical protein
MGGAVPVLVLLLSLLGAVSTAWGASDWNVQLFSGYSDALLKSLNDHKLNETAPLPPRVGGSPSIDGGALVGIEVEWRVRRRFSLVALTSFWEGESSAVESGEILFQDFGIVPFTAKRTTRVSFNEFALRGRYHLLDEPKRYRLYFELGFFNQVKVSYTEDFNYVFKANGQQFLRNVLSRASSRGGYLVTWGIGGEYYLTRWAAISLTANYRLGNAVPLYYKSYRHTFLEQDAIGEAIGGGSPFPNRGDTVTFLDTERNLRRPLEMELSGWQTAVGIRFFF